MDLDPPLRVGRLKVSVLRSGRMGLKVQLFQGLWLTQARGREGYGMRDEPAAAEGNLTLHSLRRTVHSPSYVVPGSWVPGSQDPGSGGPHRFPGGAVWRVTCARTQASWWRKQQP